jgi:hypothetical protein
MTTKTHDIIRPAEADPVDTDMAKLEAALEDIRIGYGDQRAY